MNTKLYILGIRVLCATVLLGTTSGVYAQQDEKRGKDLNREMTLEREYDPSVQDASKINSLPVVKEPQVRKMPIDYSTFTVPVEPGKELGILGSGKIMTDMEFNKRRGYVNFGGGNYLNLNGDLGYHILSTEKDKLGLYFSHRSTNGNIKSIQDDEKRKAKLNDNIGMIHYKHEFQKVSLKLAGQYGYSAFNYYGYPGYSVSSDLSNSLLDKNQANQQLYLNGGVASKGSSAFNYLLDLSYRNFSRKYGLSPDIKGAKENNVGLNLDLNAGFDGNKKIGLAILGDYFSYGLPDNYKDSFLDIDNHAEVTLSPYFSVEGSNWNVKLGVNAMFITGKDNKIFASPNIMADVEIAKSTVLYASFLGEAKANSMYQVSLENRYVNPMSAVKTSRTWMDGTIGIKSGVAPGFWFDVFAGYKITDNEHFFIPEMEADHDIWGNVGAPVYMNAKLFHAGAILKYSYQQLVDFTLKGVYNAWTVNADENAVPLDPTFKPEAYNKPKMELDATIDVKPIDKLTISLNYYLGTDRYACVNGRNEKMNNINELNVKGSYAFNNTFGAYVKVNNMLSQKYDMFYGYKTQGFNAMVGVNLNF